MCIAEDMTQMMVSMFVGVVLKNFKLTPSDSSSIDFTGICNSTLSPKPQKIAFKPI